MRSEQEVNRAIEQYSDMVRRLCLILRGAAAGHAAHRFRSRPRASAVLAEIFRLTLRTAGMADPCLIDRSPSCISLNRHGLQSTAVVTEFSPDGL